MARPKKKIIDYFSHDVIHSGSTLFTLEANFGNDGYAFWFKLLEILGAQEELFFDCSIKSNLIFIAAKSRMSIEKAEEILAMLSDLEAIDTQLWEKKRIIWVQKFVDRISDVFKKRGTETPIKPSFCDRNQSSELVSDAKSTQSKVKKSKVNITPKESNKRACGEFQNVFLTEEENSKLTKEFTEAKAKEYIEEISAYMQASGKKYKDHYAALLNWGRRDDKNKKPTKSESGVIKEIKSPTRNYSMEEIQAMSDNLRPEDM